MSNSAFASPVDYATFPWDRPRFFQISGTIAHHWTRKLLIHSFLVASALSLSSWLLLTLCIPLFVFDGFFLIYPVWLRRKWSRKFREAGQSTTVEFEIPIVVPTKKIRRSQAFNLADLTISLLLLIFVLGIPLLFEFPLFNSPWKYLVALFPLGMSVVSIRGIIRTQRLLRHPQPDQLLVLQQGLLWESWATGWFYPWSMIESASWRQGHESETLLLKTRFTPKCNPHYEHVETRGVTPADRERLLELIQQHSTDSSSSTEQN